MAVVNLMSAPGAGKTTLLERALPGLPGVRVGVLEGDVAGSLDADRLSRLHVPVTQLNTDQGFGGECHLDANMVRSALPEVPLDEIDLLVIENVGNLVCPAEFRVGEDARAMVCSITEGEDKPLKYPLMFRACELVIVNKIDLLPHLDVDLDLLLANIDAVNPDVPTLLTSARTGEGVDALRDWLVGVAARERVATLTRGPRARLEGLLERRTRRRAFFAAEAGRHRAPLPRDGRAVRARRPPDRARAPRRARARTPATWRSSSCTR